MNIGEADARARAEAHALPDQPASSHQELDLLLTLVGAAVSERSGDDQIDSDALAPVLDGSFDWALFQRLTLESKCVRFVDQGARQCALAPPSEVSAKFAAAVQRINALNAINLATVREIAPAFAEAGVAFLVLKGPLTQERLHGTYFAKASSDVDILVERKNMERARKVLAQKGFRLAPQCRSLWWRTFLREEHHIAPSAALAPVDLHSGLHQPGTAIPRNLEAMFAQREMVSFAGQAAPAPSSADVAIICVVGFIKALFNRETALIYLTDLRAWLAKNGLCALQALRRRACEQRLTRAVEFALSAIDVVFGSSDSRPNKDEPSRFGSLNRQHLRMACVSPRFAHAYPLRRTTLMWDVHEDPVTFAGGLVWRHIAEAERRMEVKR